MVSEVQKLYTNQSYVGLNGSANLAGTSFTSTTVAGVITA